MPPGDKPRGEWGRTVLAVERVKNSPFFEEPDAESKLGYFDGRRVIGRDTPVNGGVYIGAGEREAIVVDDTKEQDLIDVYATLRKRRALDISQNDLAVNKGVLNEIYRLVMETLPYSQAVVDRVAARLAHSPKNPNRKVGLGVYILEHGGVCRHQALLGAYLLEKLTTSGTLRGTVSVDRNTVPGQGGHAWIRYVNSGGDVIVIDPAQKYIGKLQDVGADRWFYERPEDVAKP